MTKYMTINYYLATHVLVTASDNKYLSGEQAPQTILDDALAQKLHICCLFIKPSSGPTFHLQVGTCASNLEHVNLASSPSHSKLLTFTSKAGWPGMRWHVRDVSPETNLEST